jgi:antitoxin ParD1/3/4
LAYDATKGDLAMATMNVSLPDQMKKWIEDQVATGRYGNASDYVRDVVRKDQERAEARAKLQQMVDEALASGTVRMTREELLERTMSRAKAAVEARKSA